MSLLFWFGRGKYGGARAHGRCVDIRSVGSVDGQHPMLDIRFILVER